MHDPVPALAQRVTKVLLLHFCSWSLFLPFPDFFLSSASPSLIGSWHLQGSQTGKTI